MKGFRQGNPYGRGRSKKKLYGDLPKSPEPPEKRGPGRPKKKKNGKGKDTNGDAEWKEFLNWKENFQRLDSEGQALYCLYNKLNPATYRLKQSQTLEFESVNIGSLKIYYRDVQLFGQVYLDLYAPDHQTEILIFLANHKKCLILEPREHGKTTTIATFLVHKICFNRQVRIKYYSKNEKKAGQFIRFIKKHLQRNRKIHRDFGQFHVRDLERKNEWSSFAFTVDRPRIDPNPTVEALGQGSSGTGGRADIIIFDDFFDADDCESQKKRGKISRRFWGEIRQLLDSDFEGQIIVLGTRKHYKDLYQEIMENPAWYVLKRPAILNDFTEDDFEIIYDEYKIDPRTKKRIIKINPETGEPMIILKKPFQVLWPEKWPIRKLLALRAEIGSLLFEREKQNNPAPMKGLKFKYKWLKFWRDKEDLKQLFDIENLPKYLVVDLAASERQEADYTGMAIICIDPRTYAIIVLDISHKRERLEKTYKTALEMCKRIKANYKVGVVQWVVEAIGILGIDTEDWPRRQETIDGRYSIKFVKTQNYPKTRIRSLGPRMENGQFYLHRSHAQLIREIIEFDASDEEHILDAIEMGIREIDIAGATGIMDLPGFYG
jgi:hypothetical protein